MKITPRNTTLLPAVATLLFFITGCTTMEDVLSWQRNRTMTEQDVSRFVSDMRQVPGNPSSHYRLAAYYQKSGRHREAIEEFQKTLLIDPGHIKAWNALGVCYDMLGEYENARAAYEKALTLAPGNGYVLNNMAYSLLLQGKADEAINLLKDIGANTSEKVVTNNLGLAYAMKDQLQPAMEAFGKAGDEAAAHLNMGRVFYQKGFFDEAQRQFEEALALDPKLEGAVPGLRASSSLAFINGRSGSDGIKESQNKTDSVAQLSKETIKETIDETRISPDAKIEISNGNGVSFMARRVGDYLREKGYPVVRLTNAGNFGHSKTSIIYAKGYRDGARKVSGNIPVAGSLKQVNNSGKPGIKIKLLLGKDLVPFKNTFVKEHHS